MNQKTKKTIAALVAGAFLLGGVAAPLLASAASSNAKQHAGYHQRQADPDKVAQKIADTFGVDKTAILNYHASGASFKDLHHAAFLSYASGKSLEQVMPLKNETNSWRDVASTLGVSKEQAKSAHQTLQANLLHDKLQLDTDKTLSLLQQGYKGRDIAVASLLAQDADKSVEAVLAMKKINNTWRAVATDLGISDETMKADMQKLHNAFPHQGKRHHQ